MEGPHRQLSSRFPDRLRRDNPYRQALFDLLSGREIHSVTLGAGSECCVTCQGTSHENLVVTQLLNSVGNLESDQSIGLDDDFS